MIPVAPLIVVPVAGAGFAWLTTRFVLGRELGREATRERARRQIRWTTIGSAAALLVAGILVYSCR